MKIYCLHPNIRQVSGHSFYSCSVCGSDGRTIGLVKESLVPIGMSVDDPRWGEQNLHRIKMREDDKALTKS